MKANTNKCHLQINESCKKEIKIACNITENRKREKLLGIKADSKPSVKAHAETL